MTSSEAGNAVGKALIGLAGDKAIGALLMIIIAISGWVLKTTYDHSNTLTGLDIKMTALIDIVHEHHLSVDERIGRIYDTESAQRDEISALKEALAAQQGRMMPRRMSPE